MAHYAIGDVQGCYDELQALLDNIRFDPANDTLWFVGDLVNRGPQSLQVLRLVKSLGAHAVTVLGNHDLHLLAVALGLRANKNDTFDAILNASDRDELLDWLRHRPLLHHDTGLGYTMIHAGLPPQWDLARAQACAAEVEVVLQSSDHGDLMNHMYGDQPEQWSNNLTGWERLRFIINCFTRLRYCDRSGRLALDEKGPPDSQAGSLMPWFDVPGRKSAEMKIIFGHWSALGRYSRQGIYALDSGCVWGGSLTAMRLDARPHWFDVPCSGCRVP